MCHSHVRMQLFSHKTYEWLHVCTCLCNIQCAAYRAKCCLLNQTNDSWFHQSGQKQKIRACQVCGREEMEHGAVCTTYMQRAFYENNVMWETLNGPEAATWQRNHINVSYCLASVYTLCYLTSSSSISPCILVWNTLHTTNTLVDCLF